MTKKCFSLALGLQIKKKKENKIKVVLKLVKIYPQNPNHQ